MVRTSAQRVMLHTPMSVNDRLRSEAERRIEYYAIHPEMIEQRLAELDREWDIERFIETEAPGVTMFGIVMSVIGGRKWLLLPLFAQTMLLTHALQGFYPWLSLLRTLGFRTQQEIAEERYALRILRGDFESVGDTSQGTDVRANVAFMAARIRPM